MLSSAVLFAALAITQQQAPRNPPAPAAQARPASERSATAEPVATEEQRVCRMEPVTGSRFGRRVCRNNAQSSEDRAAGREMLRQMQGARTPPVG